MKVLLGDLGGTHLNFEIYDRQKILFEKSYETKDFCDSIKLLNKVIADSKHKVKKCILAIAGPVEKDKIAMTNAYLVFDKKKILKETVLEEIVFMNDFTALGYAINVLGKNDLLEIHKGKKQNKKTKALIGAGTGLGKAILNFDNGVYVPISSEGGHGDFPAETDREFKLVKFLQKKLSTKEIVWEDLISGRGLENIYEYLARNQKGVVKTLSSEEISRSKKDSLCKESFEMFFKFYARAAKDFALEVLAEGGLYLGGGIIAKNLDFNYEDFLKEFLTHPTYVNLLEKIPIFIIKDYNASMRGLEFYSSS
ncbi:MAG: glucokinase [Nanoarchaeota archaeon]